MTGTESVLLEEWSGPYGGVPPLDRVDVAELEPALEAGMADQLAEVERIASNTSRATFENTLEALERSGQALDRVLTVYGIWSSSMSSPEFQEVQRRMAPRLAAFRDRIVQNDALFRRIRTVYESIAATGAGGPTLTAEQQRLAWLHYTDFVRAGAELDPDQKARLSEINQRLAALFTAFNQKVLADEQDQYLVLGGPDDLVGLPSSLRSAAAEAARAKGLDGRWAIANTRSAIEPFLTYSTRRDLRERAWRMWIQRGEPGQGEAGGNPAVVSEILTLRTERADLLGYETHAHWALEHSMAGIPERALELLREVWPAAVGRVREEVEAMANVVPTELSGDGEVEPWDYRYFMEKVRKVEYELDQDEVKPYLQLGQMRQAMFWVAGRLFDLRFERVHDVPVFHSEVEVWRVSRGSSGDHVGLWYFDPFARGGKRSGAWMNAYRSQQRLEGPIPPIVSNNSNFVRGVPDEPVLISWEDLRTLFHEFGHALHGLLSDVRYPSLAGTAVARDYVEFPSQLLEHWLSTPEVLRRFALHVETGEPMPAWMIERLDRASTFNQGFATTEFLASALVDMEMHLEAAAAEDPQAFQQQTLDRLGMPTQIEMRHRAAHFQHVFGGDGYAGAYYSYLWADVLSADAFQAFDEAGDLFDREVADRLRTHVFSAGNTSDPAEAYRRFRGRDPSVEALMQERGFR